MRALATEPSTASELAALIAAVERRRARRATRQGRSSELLELALQSGRIRSVYGPGGEQAALRAYRRLPARGRADRERARGDRGAARRSRARAALGRDRGGRPGRVRAEARPPARRALRPARPPGRAARERGRLMRARPTTPRTSTSTGATASSSAAEGRRSRRRGPARARRARHRRRAADRRGARALAVAWRRALPSADLDGRFLVIAATLDSAVNRRVSGTPRRAACSATSPTTPELCNFILPAIHRARADHDRGLDLGRLARAREAAPRRVRRAGRRAARRARRATARAAAVGSATLPDLRAAARLLRASSSRRRCA